MSPLLFAVFTADMPTLQDVQTATYADDTVLMVSNADPKVASEKMQIALDAVEDWTKEWRIKINGTKSAQVSFTLRKETCPPVQFGGQSIPVRDEVTYLGLHLDKRLTWRKHIWTKRCQLNLKARKMYWLLNRQSKLSL
ncbi:hypothetical protein DMENIID0001_149330 [Sergentomyia squamirostris]